VFATRNRLLHLIGAATLLAISAAAYRTQAVVGTCGNCLVGSIFVRSDGWVLATPGTTLANGPACGEANASWLAIDPSTDRGRALLSLVQLALLSGRTANWNGTDTCGGAGNVEQMSQFELMP
jgi:hypothetical protein